VVRQDVPALARPARGLIDIRLGLQMHHCST
jgi:hypothetical protein